MGLTCLTFQQHRITEKALSCATCSCAVKNLRKHELEEGREKGKRKGKGVNVVSKTGTCDEKTGGRPEHESSAEDQIERIASTLWN